MSDILGIRTLAALEKEGLELDENPKLPEGYREEYVGEQHRLLDPYGGIIASIDCGVVCAGAAPTVANLAAIIVFLRRRAE